MAEQEQDKGKFSFEGDTKQTRRFIVKRRFSVKTDAGITGFLYIPKKEGCAVPDKIILERAV